MNMQRRESTGDIFSLPSGQESEQWKRIIGKVSRAVVVTIKNNTNAVLVRENYNIPAGEWKKFPPEKILPNTEVQCASGSQAFMSGTEAEVKYRLPDGEMISFQWNNPYVGTKSYSAKGPPSVRISSWDATESNVTKSHQLYNVIFTLFGELKVPEESTQEPAIPPIVPLDEVVSFSSGSLLDSFGSSLKSSQTSSKEEHKEKKLDLNRSYHHLSVNDLEDLEASQRSALITLKNTSTVVLERVSYKIISGKWSVLPPEVVKPNSEYEFSTKSSEVGVKGTSGKVIYRIKQDPNSDVNPEFFEMMWNNPLVGENEVKIRTLNDSNRYKLEGHIHKGNLFRVLFFVGEKIQMQIFNQQLEKLNCQFLYDLFKYFADNEIYDEDVLRKPANFLEVQQLRQLIESGTEIDYKSFKVQSLFKIIKMFLKELKEPLIPNAFYTAFISSHSDKDLMKHLIKKIPPMNEYVLTEVAHYLYCFCYDVEQDELDSVKVSSVCAIFGPIICKSPLNQKVMDSTRYQSMSLALLIRNFEFLFEKKPISRLENIEALEKAADHLEQQYQALTSEAYSTNEDLDLSIQQSAQKSEQLKQKAQKFLLRAEKARNRAQMLRKQATLVSVSGKEEILLSLRDKNHTKSHSVSDLSPLTRRKNQIPRNPIICKSSPHRKSTEITNLDEFLEVSSNDGNVLLYDAFELDPDELEKFLYPARDYGKSTDAISNEKFLDILTDPLSCFAFSQFLKKSTRSHSLLEFWLEIENFRSLAPRKPDILERNAKSLYTRYFQRDSVLVPKKLKRELENTIFLEQAETPKLHIFDRLQDFVFRELQRDFPLFKSSEHYRRVRVAQLKRVLREKKRTLASGLLSSWGSKSHSQSHGSIGTDLSSSQAVFSPKITGEETAKKTLQQFIFSKSSKLTLKALGLTSLPKELDSPQFYITCLDLSHNGLTALPQQFILNHLVALKELYLDFNFFEAIPKELVFSQSLTVLSLPKEIGKLQTLTYLGLKGNEKLMNIPLSIIELPSYIPFVFAIINRLIELKHDEREYNLPTSTYYKELSVDYWTALIDYLTLVRLFELDLAPKGHWVPDKDRNACFACNAVFTNLNRRHHCRLCGDIFCGNCSTKRCVIPGLPFEDPVRVCDTCFMVVAPSRSKDHRTVTNEL